MNFNRNFLEEDVILTDTCSKSNKAIKYFKLKDTSDEIGIYAKDITSWNYLNRLQSLIKDIFLPKGYPDSVSSDYLEYQIWDTCQAFCSSICGTLTMRAVMQGIGVGSETATPVSAAITWIMKDGTGMVGSILFAWFKGSKFDSDCKKWRLFADILNDVAMFIELYIPHLIDYSMYMLCIATVFKALVGTAGSSTRAALITHQAIKGNIADVSAKDGSQEIFINLLAFVFGIIVLKNVTEADHVWALMCTSTMFHLIFNYNAVRCLKMNVFNSERFRLTLRTYLPTSDVPSVEQVNRREAIFLGMGTCDILFCGFSIVFGASLINVIKAQKITFQQLTTITTVFQAQNYCILVLNKKKTLYVTFRQNFEENDVLKAYFHAFVLGIALDYMRSERRLHITRRSRKNSPIFRLKNILHEFKPSTSNSNLDEPNAIVLKAYLTCQDFIEKEFLAFSKICSEQGWNMNKHLINIDEWRASWNYVREKTDLPRRTILVIWLFNKKFTLMLC